MKYEVIDNFKVKTTLGIREFTKGQIIPVHSSKVTMLIEKEKIKPILPYLSSGYPVIPFDCDPKYHYWCGGQSVQETINELTELTSTES